MAEYDRPLRLTTPHRKGPEVRDAQWLMQGHTRFGPELAPYKDGPLDSDYGLMTANATASTKFWVGYPLAACDRVFGQTLYEYIRPTRWRPLPADYRDRRAKRLAAAHKTIGEKALEEAVRFLGVKESPWGSNRQQFGVEYGMNGEPWCAIFVSCMFRHVGYVTPSGAWRFRYSYVPAIWDDAVNGRNGLRRVWTPKPGDLACYDLRGEQLAHVAFVRTAPAGGRFTDLGGNTGPADISNGGEVASQSRSLDLVHGWVRVGA
jgi:CHAP domain